MCRVQIDAYKVEVVRVYIALNRPTYTLYENALKFCIQE
jgi:hypothetical protein